MSLPVRNPTFLAGANRSSGDVQTGEMSHVRGGGRTFCIYSGALTPAVTAAPGAVAGGAGSVVFFSGAGRLNSFIQHTVVQSGAPIVFYDSAIACLSGLYTTGTISASGMKIVGVFPQPTNPTQSGTAILWNGEPTRFEFPFQSGLSALCYSGAPGFSITMTPEVSSNFPNV